MAEINNISLPFIPANGINGLKRQNVRTTNGNNELSFKNIFDDELNKIKFSAHAQSRLTSREISLSSEDLTRLSSAFERAEQKGANESLIILNDNAYIVSVPNKTVITVVDKTNIGGTVFTNIDSAVIA